MKNQSKIWDVRPKVSSELSEQLLSNRGVSAHDKEKFLSPQYKDLANPRKIEGLSKAVNLILEAAKNDQKIGIFADYDADGTTSAALVFDLLKKLKIPSVLYIPTRKEGYGLNKKALELFRKEKTRLIVILDSGIRNISEIKQAKNMGFEVIIIDHHEPAANLPSADVIIDPKKQTNKASLDILSTGGLVFKLIQEVGRKTKRINESFQKWSLDLVAISTISDVVPLLSENRILAKFGLVVLQKTRRPGLKSLYQIAGIDPAKINTYTVGFQIGPRINAPGRLDHATQSFYLLTTSDQCEAKELAKTLDKINLERQKELEKVLKEARKKVEDKKLAKNKVLVVDGENWPDGVVGLVAGKLMEEYARPVLVASRKGNWVKGSARSIDGYHLVEAFDESRDFLRTYGGHARAAGFSLETKHLENLYDKLLDLAEVKLKGIKLLPRLYIDAEIESKEINWKTLKLIDKFEPFGLGNPRPSFVLKNVRFSSYQTCGKNNNHLRGLVRTEDGRTISFIGFDLGWWGKLLQNRNYDVACYLDRNEWNGKVKLELRLLDIREAQR